MPLSKLANISVFALSGSLAIFGGELLLTPHPVSHFFGVPLSNESAIYARVFGVRMITLGALLWKTRSEYAKSIAKDDGVLMDYARRDLRRVLFVSLFTDVADIGCSLIGLRTGELSTNGFGWFAGLGASGAGLATLALRIL